MHFYVLSDECWVLINVADEGFTVDYAIGVSVINLMFIYTSMLCHVTFES